jgi:hypothetical protein
MRRRRKGGGEALTGVRAGRVLSREIHDPPRAVATSGCRRVEKRKATPAASPSRGAGTLRGQRPCARTEHLAREPGDPGSPAAMGRRAASGSPRTHADDERTREVGHARSTGEVAERRATGCGGDGGKGLAKGTRLSATRPDTEPDQARPARWSGYGKQQRDRKQRFTALLHHVYDVERLRAAYLALKRDAAPASTARRGGTTGRPGGEPPGPLRTAEAGGVPGEAGASGRTSRRRTGGSGRSGSHAGRQDRPARRRSRC